MLSEKLLISDTKVTISIVIPTIGRDIEVDKLLSSIFNSSVQPLEIIVVDQNCSNILEEIISKYLNILPIFHYKVNFKGLSRAKNFGKNFARGNYIYFPDDDCELLENTLKIALEKIILTKTSIVFGKCVDFHGNDSVLNFSKNEDWLSKRNFEGKGVEAAMIASMDIMKNYEFDECLGAGTFHGAEEGYDLVYRLLENKVKIYYSPTIIVYHPQIITDYSHEVSIKRVYTYRCGFSKLCLKHKFYLKLFNRFFLVISAIVIYFILNNKKKKYYFAEFAGLLSGLAIK